MQKYTSPGQATLALSDRGVSAMYVGRLNVLYGGEPQENINATDALSCGHLQIVSLVQAATEDVHV